jgi:hypothetical protein
MDRRAFIGGAAASGIMILSSRTAFSYEANSAVRIGLLGCGSRGTTVATSFAKNTPARIVALADLFPDQLAAAKTHFDQVNASLGVPAIDPSLMFRGSHAFEELAASKAVDSIQISTPPWFHVQHLDAAIAAGKHAYCEKPLGVDVAQTQHALEIGKRAQGRVSLDVGFQVRSAPPIAEVVRRIHAGDLGKLVCISAHYNAPNAVSHSGANWSARRVPPAQLALGPRPLRRHPRRAEHPRHRPLQLDHRRSPHQSHCHWRPQRRHARRRYLGQLPGDLHLPQRRPPQLFLDAVGQQRILRCHRAGFR